jgi:hypothetical protein
MNQNLNIWKDELFREFKSNKFASLKKAKKLIFRFDESFYDKSIFFEKDESSARRRNQRREYNDWIFLKKSRIKSDSDNIYAWKREYIEKFQK